MMILSHATYDCSQEYKEFIGEFITTLGDLWIVKHTCKENAILEDQDLIDKIDNLPYNSGGSFNKTIDFKGELENLFNVKLEDMNDSLFIDTNEFLYDFEIYSDMNVNEFIYYPYEKDNVNFEEYEDDILYKIKEDSNLIVQRIYKTLIIAEHESLKEKYITTRISLLSKVEGTDYQILIRPNLYIDPIFCISKELQRFIFKRYQTLMNAYKDRINENSSDLDIKEYIYKFFI